MTRLSPSTVCCRACAPWPPTFLDRKTVDLALDVDHIDLLHRFERERRKDRQLDASIKRLCSV
jgi:hypothetical protein